ncbi:MAG: CopG family transcriptional regulator [Spirochaetales bacterium]|nr:CopG family transcriptional regulator [Spirochaetales bacterium]
MAKTVTLRIDDDTYDLIKLAATGERRSISNFIEYATMAFLAEESFVTDTEMDEILNDEKLLKGIVTGNEEIKAGKYRVIG